MELCHKSIRGGRLSDVLKNEIRISTGLMNRLKLRDGIQVNGIPRWTNFEVSPGDTVTLLMEEPEPEYPAEEMDLTVLYEDDHILAVEKPAGMLIHPSRCRDTGTLANGIIGYYRKTGQKGAFHPITRLDRDTFGVVLVAKNAHVHALLQGGDLRKTYHALVFGGPQADAGVIDAPIARHPLPSLLRYVDPSGKSSVTEYRVLERRRDCALLELSPITGRTHQLRVHCAYCGFPILGDPQYGSEESQALSLEKGYTYQRLCAKSITLIHPLTGEKLTIHSNQNP